MKDGEKSKYESTRSYIYNCYSRISYTIICVIIGSCIFCSERIAIMSWLDRKILNKDTSIIVPQVSEEEKQYREIREDTTTIAEVQAKGTPNIVKVGKDKFICGACNGGWAFSRMKTILCCGITYVRD